MLRDTRHPVVLEFVVLEGNAIGCLSYNDGVIVVRRK